VLYDAPGPVARRNTLIGSIVATAVILVSGYWFVFQPLAAKGQFSMELWGPLIDPGNEYFFLLWKRIGTGFQATLLAAALAILSSLLVGTGIAVLRIQLKAVARHRHLGVSRPVALALRGLTLALSAVTRAFVEVFRGTPVVITVFFVSAWLPTIGASSAGPGGASSPPPLAFDNPMWYLVIGLTIYNGVVIGEILRSGMEGLPGGQREAADALGLTPFQTIRLVLLPQAYRVMLPALISQLVVVLKDTSLGFIISYEEILRVSGQVIEFLDNPIQMYAVVGTIFILVNYALSRLARYAQRRLA
jgi:glutamate transport system permease protein